MFRAYLLEEKMVWWRTVKMTTGFPKKHRQQDAAFNERICPGMFVIGF